MNAFSLQRGPRYVMPTAAFTDRSRGSSHGFPVVCSPEHTSGSLVGSATSRSVTANPHSPASPVVCSSEHTSGAATRATDCLAQQWQAPRRAFRPSATNCTLGDHIVAAHLKAGRNSYSFLAEGSAGEQADECQSLPAETSSVSVRSIKRQAVK